MLLIGVSSIMWTVWRLRNAAIFDNEMITDPGVPIKMLANWLHDWSHLQKKPGGRRMLEMGIKMYEREAAEIFQKMAGWRLHTGRIQN